MFFRIDFTRSKVPYSEREDYLRKLDAAARANKYCPGKAYIPANCANYEVIVADKLGMNSANCYSDEIKSILRELRKRKCDVFSLG